jgi:hypothetical protein
VARPQRSAAGKIFTPKESFYVTIDGAPKLLRKDVDRVREGHPLYEAHKENFVELSVEYDIEQATAAPGEVRA